jgi:hypothetical protein
MTDALTYDGARRLAHLIEAYWVDRGFEAITRIEDERYRQGCQDLYCVRSDMINGQPTRKLARM